MVTWHVGEKFPISMTMIEEDAAGFIQADGDELTKIHALVRGIPMGSGRVSKWFGDTAKFIASELYMDADRQAMRRSVGQ